MGIIDFLQQPFVVCILLFIIFLGLWGYVFGEVVSSPAYIERLNRLLPPPTPEQIRAREIGLDDYHNLGDYDRCVSDCLESSFINGTLIEAWFLYEYRTECWCRGNQTSMRIW